MRRPAAALLVAIVLASAFAAGCSSSSGTSSAPADAAALVKDRCTRCHPVDRIKSAQHDAAAWSATVTRMRGKGAELSDDEAQQVIDFLAGGGASKL